MGSVLESNSKQLAGFTSTDFQRADAPLLGEQSNNSIVDKLRMEANLLGSGLSKGFLDRGKEALNDPLSTGLEIGAVAGTAAAINIMSDLGGRWGTAAKVLGVGLAGIAAGDLFYRAKQTVGAITDTWSNPENFEKNKDTVGKYAGSALFDYPIMGAAGYAALAGSEAGFMRRSMAVSDTAGSAKGLSPALAPSEQFSRISDVLHGQLKLAKFELPSAGYKPLFADGAPPPKPLKFDPVRHPSFVQVPFEKGLPVRTELPKLAELPSLDSLIAKKTSFTVLPIIPLALMQNEQTQKR